MNALIVLESGSDWSQSTSKYGSLPFWHQATKPVGLGGERAPEEAGDEFILVLKEVLGDRGGGCASASGR